MNHPTQKNQRLRELAAVFLKLGVTGFGGPAAHIAMMEDEVVRRRQWVSHAAFLDMLGATNLIPGPNSTELAIHIGRERAGTAGLIVAGTCFILPAMVLVLLCAWAYVTFGQLPQVAAVFYGLKPVILAIVIQALWRLGQSAVKGPWLALIAALAAVAAFLGINELVVLFAAALVATFHRGSKPPSVAALLAFFPRSSEAAPLGRSVTIAAAATAAAPAPFGLWPLFLFFLKVGSVLFGSGYVLLAFLRADLVERWHWLSETQLLDAIAIGQITPGPVFTTATFIGYLLGGMPGGLVATAGIFLPAFVFVALSAPYIPKLRASPTAGRFLDGLNVASLALMAVVTFRLGQGALHDLFTTGLAIVATALLILTKVNSTWLVLGGAVVGFLFFQG